jgi:hypothetical protein
VVVVVGESTNTLTVPNELGISGLAACCSTC